MGAFSKVSRLSLARKGLLFSLGLSLGAGCPAPDRGDMAADTATDGLDTDSDPSDSTTDPSNGDTDGDDERFDVGNGDGSDTDDDPNCGHTLPAVVRDFSADHPDFEGTLGTDRGIVESMLGPDGKPVYAGEPTTPTTTGQDNFDQWYRDVDGTNVPISIELELMAAGAGQYTIDDSEFFPIDDQGFGNEGNGHNYHFTLELHTNFVYEGGEVFEFRGDDDLFVFINGRLAMDLGGVHSPQEDAVDLDAEADTLGLEIGGRYPLDFFFAERHTVMSNFRIETTISCFEPPV